MKPRKLPARRAIAFLGTLTALTLSACGGNSETLTPAGIPQLSPATGSAFNGDCAALQPLLTSLVNTTITLATTVPAGSLTVAGSPIQEHCRLVGKMNQRVSPVDGNNYAIGFEIRMPKNWNGRFFYQANGGIDGNIGTATGGIGGGGALSNGLSKGFAVLSSDAGHSGPTPFFGLDPQARLDYGYNAVGQLTPMAKNLIKTVYGKSPDRSYLVGCSNGGRHAMVAASRYADQYDGIVAGDPGFNLPKAAVAQLWGVQQYAGLATATVGTTGLPDITTSFTVAELNMVSTKILDKCDALDGATDGLIGDLKACQSAFNLTRDVPVCTGARDGTCLTYAQKTVLANVHSGARNSSGAAIYTSFPYDAGINGTSGSGWRAWKFGNSLTRDPGAVAFIFSTPPVPNPGTFNDLAYAFNFNMDLDAPKIFATNGTYTVAPMTFMTPPEPTNLSTLKNRGAKLIVYHGTSDPIFSYDDTASWYEGLRAANGGDASSFARLFPVPGMNHCSGGPAADQFDMVDAIVKWVEQGAAPETVIATARGAGAVSVNTEVPSGWSANRTRPLCAYPKVPRYNGTGNMELASSFTCR